MSRFEIRPPFVIFHDDKPGSHATMFAPNGTRMRFRGDASVFDDANRSFSWAFEGRVREGDRIVFATADREVAGVVQAGGAVETQAPNPDDIERVDGKPLELAGDLLPSVSALLEPPHPTSPMRPVQMKRPAKFDLTAVARALFEIESIEGGYGYSWESLGEESKATWGAKAEKLIAAYEKFVKA